MVNFYVVPTLLAAATYTYFLGGQTIRMMSRSLADNVIGGATEGAASGAGGAAVNIFAEALGKVSGESIGKAVAREFEGFATGANLNPTSAGSKVSEAAQKIIKGINLGKISETSADQLNNGFDNFWDTVNTGEKAGRIGEELRTAINEFTKEAGKGMRAGVGNTLGEIAKGLNIDVLPYFLIGTVVTVATPLFVRYLYQKAIHNIGRPKLSSEIYQRTIFSPLTERIGSLFSCFSRPQKPIFDPETEALVEEVTESTHNIRNNDGYFQNAVVYGPGGTGKTMIGEKIAKDCKMSYIKMSGGDLAQYIKRGEHVTELNKLMDKVERSWRPWSTSPWFLFIDEAESMCRHRWKLPTAELLELQNAFLKRTGTQSKKNMIMLATNRIEDLDEAVLSRMDRKIYIGPPKQTERELILKAYIPQFFSRKERAAFFSDTQIVKLAQDTDGLTGRALFKLLNAILNKKATTKDNKLTQEIIDKKVKDFVEQEKRLAEHQARNLSLQGPTPAPATLDPAKPVDKPQIRFTIQDAPDTMNSAKIGA